MMIPFEIARESVVKEGLAGGLAIKVFTLRRERKGLLGWNPSQLFHPFTLQKRALDWLILTNDRPRTQFKSNTLPLCQTQRWISCFALPFWSFFPPGFSFMPLCFYAPALFYAAKQKASQNTRESGNRKNESAPKTIVRNQPKYVKLNEFNP